MSRRNEWLTIARVSQMGKYSPLGGNTPFAFTASMAESAWREDQAPFYPVGDAQ